MSMEINEAEEYLGLLWELRKVNEQIGTMHNALCSNGIEEFSSSDESKQQTFSDGRQISSDEIVPPISSYLTDLDNLEHTTDSSAESYKSNATPLTDSHASIPSPSISAKLAMMLHKFVLLGPFQHCPSNVANCIMMFASSP